MRDNFSKELSRATNELYNRDKVSGHSFGFTRSVLSKKNAYTNYRWIDAFWRIHFTRAFDLCTGQVLSSIRNTLTRRRVSCLIRTTRGGLFLIYDRAHRIIVALHCDESVLAYIICVTLGFIIFER